MEGRTCLLFVLVVVAMAPAVRAQPTEPRVAMLIARLGSRSYLERQKASEELARLGTLGKKQLELAVSSDDPEVRLRAKDLLKQIDIQELWSPGKISYQCRDEPVAKVLAAIAAQTGNRLLVGEPYGQFQDLPVTLNVQDAPFWQVLDDLCRQSKNHVRSHYDLRNPGLVVVAGAPGRNPVGHAGPVRAMVTSARRVFIEELDFDDLDSERTHTFQLHFQILWEDRFRLIAFRSQPELAEAITDTGAALLAAQSVGGGWNVASSGSHQLTMELRLHPPATTARQLDRLKLKWGVVAVGDLSKLEVTNLTSPAPHYQDDLELIVEGIQENPPGRYELTVVAGRDVGMPEPQEVLFQENELELFDEQGRAMRKQGQSNSLCERGARFRVSFAAETPDSKPKTLRFTYPRIRARQNLEIEFKNVPLPTGRPE